VNCYSLLINLPISSYLIFKKYYFAAYCVSIKSGLLKKVTIILALLLFISCKDEKPQSKEINVPNYAELSGLDVKLRPPLDGEWLKEHKETDQTFEQYIAKKPVTVSEKRKVIYLQPIGIFSSLENKMLNLTAEYIGYFFGLRTVLLEPISADNFPRDQKRTWLETEQLNASYIINKILPDKTPDDGIVIMGLTARDLYPYENWNYVFGLASYSKRTAVTSMYRFEDLDFMDENYSLCLNRLIKTSAHEIGHMFTLPHCVHAECMMNGANHIGELDRQTNTLCSVCLAKLSWNLNFDNAKRMKKMISFYKKHQLNLDAVILQKQYDILKK
jgi:archaemetzincin